MADEKKKKAPVPLCTACRSARRNRHCGRRAGGLRLFRPAVGCTRELSAYRITGTVVELDALGNHMIDAEAEPEDPAPDSTMPPVLTYWGQFLDHELTARTDRESEITSVKDPHPPAVSSTVEGRFRNARSPRFDLDSVYGGSPVGAGITADMVTVISGLRHPTLVNKMRVGTAIDPGPLPDGLDEHRDLPRYVQVQASVRDAALRTAQASMTAEEFAKFSAGLPQRALIGDTRNDENLVVAQFHLSFLRFHNKAIDFLASHNTGWIADFTSAQALTRLHYQWLIVEGYLKGVCDPAVVDRVVQGPGLAFLQIQGRVRCAAAEFPTGQCVAARVLRRRLPVRAFHGSRVL